MYAQEDRTSYAVEELPSKSRSFPEVRTEEDEEEDSFVFVSEYNGPSYSEMWNESYVCEENTIVNSSPDSILDDITVSSIMDDNENGRIRNSFSDENNFIQHNENLESYQSSCSNATKIDITSKSTGGEKQTNDEFNSGEEFLSSSGNKEAPIDSDSPETVVNEKPHKANSEEITLIAFTDDSCDQNKDKESTGKDETIGITNLFAEECDCNEASRKKSILEEQRLSYIHVLDTVLSALFQDNYHAQTSTKEKNESVNVNVKCDAYCQTGDFDNIDHYDKVLEKPKVTEKTEMAINTSPLSCDPNSNELNDIKRSREIYEYYKNNDPLKFKGSNCDMNSPLKLLAYFHKTSALNEFGDTINMKDMLNYVLKDKTHGKINDIEPKNLTLPGLKFEATSHTGKETKNRMDQIYPRNSSTRKSKDVEPNAIFTYCVSVNKDQRQKLDKCILDCEQAEKQNAKLSEIWKVLQEFDDQKFIDRCVKKITEVKDHINAIQDKRLYEVQEAHNVKLTIKESLNNDPEMDRSCLKVSLAANSYRDIEQTVKIIQERLPLLSPPNTSSDHFDVSLTNNVNFFEKEFKKAFNESRASSNKKKLKLFSHGFQENSISTTIKNFNNKSDAKLEKLFEHPITKKYKFKRIMKIVETNNTHNLFRRNNDGTFISRRLGNIQDKYQIKFGKVEVVPDCKRDFKKMICVTVYYDLEERAQRVFDLLNLYVSQNKIDNDKLKKSK